MLDKEVFKEGIKKLSILFPNWNADLQDKVFVKTWYDMLKDIPDDKFKKLIDDFGYSSLYNPTVAGIRQDYSIEGKEKNREKMLEMQKKYAERG